MLSDKDTIIIQTIELTLQYPLTQSGWERLTKTLEMQTLGYGLVRLLAATPMQSEPGDAN